MGIYEHSGTRAGRVRLRELVTGRDFDTVCTSGYGGKPGELWYVRLCPPIFDLVEYHATFTTPYILTLAQQCPGSLLGARWRQLRLDLFNLLP